MRRLSAVALLAPVCIVGCGDAPLESVSRRIEAADVAFMVSNPQSDAGATSAAVFASAAVGSLGNAATARITNMSTGAAADVTLTDGGFDPIGIAAGIGDTIRLTALTSSNVISMDRLVERERPPRVVRTVPAARKRDVPLNAAVIVVFSEPVDPATLNSSSVRLRRADQAVAASVRFIDGQHLKARLEPAALLEPNTTYELAVSTAIRDLDGDHLEAPVTIEFSTGHTVNAAGAYMDQSHVTLAPGESLQLQVRQQFGYVPIDLIAWSSADPSVATVDHAGVVRGVAPGTTTITATAQGETASAEVYIAALDFVQVDAGGEHTCGLTTQGEAYCWGANWGGLLGSDARGSTTPVRVSGDLRFASLTVGSYHSCGVVADGTAYCWGGGPALGTGVDERCEPSQPDYVCSRQPRPVAGGVRFTQISAGNLHTCGISEARKAYCWGANANGTLGTGNTQRAEIPAAVAGDLDFVGISASESGTCAIAADERTYCWGLNHWYGPPYTYAALGNGEPSGPEVCAPPLYATTFPCSTVPVAITSDVRFTVVSTGWLNACGLTTAAALYCWGGGPGVVDSIPSRISGSWQAVHAAPIEGISCGIATDGQAYCWGLFFLGSSSGTYTDTPRPVPGDVRFETVTTSYYHGCGIAVDGRVYCWGWNWSGWLGNGTVTGSAEPVRILGQR